MSTDPRSANTKPDIVSSRPSRQGRLRTQTGSSASVSVKREPAAITLTSPNPARGWNHPDELSYIDASSMSKDDIISFLLQTRFSIPGRPSNRLDSWCTILSVDGTKTILPAAYRIPLLFVAEFQWWSVRLVLGVADVEMRTKEWDQFRSGIYHVARLTKSFLEAARTAQEVGGIPKKWRFNQFDRALTRYRMGWMLSVPEHLKDFYEIHGESPYERDPLASHWKSVAMKGHNGFVVSESHIDEGVSATELSKGLIRVDGDWMWDYNADPAPAPSTSTSASASPAISPCSSTKETTLKDPSVPSRLTSPSPPTAALKPESSNKKAAGKASIRPSTPPPEPIADTLVPTPIPAALPPSPGESAPTPKSKPKPTLKRPRGNSVASPPPAKQLRRITEPIVTSPPISAPPTQKPSSLSDHVPQTPTFRPVTTSFLRPTTASHQTMYSFPPPPPPPPSTTEKELIPVLIELISLRPQQEEKLKRLEEEMRQLRRQLELDDDDD